MQPHFPTLPTHAFPAAFPVHVDAANEQLPALQHALLQTCVSEHAVVHMCVVVSHAMPLAQSAFVLQPHPPATHAFPFALAEQSLHVPDAPQVFESVPAAHRPFAPQQPVAHGLESEHAVVQRCADVSQTSPLPQSEFPEQPHLPETHA